MSQQGERRTQDEDAWWSRLYDDEPTPGTGSVQPDDTLDTRFDSAANAVSPPPPSSSGVVQEPRPEPAREPEPPQRPPWPPAPAEAPDPAEPQLLQSRLPAEPGPDRPTSPGPRRPGKAEAGPSDGVDPPPPATPEPAPQSPTPPAPARPPAPPVIAPQRAPWEPPGVPQVPSARRESVPPPSRGDAPPEDWRPAPPAPSHRMPEARTPRDAPAPPERPHADPRPASPLEDQGRPPRAGFVGDRPPTYDAEPSALPAADPCELGALVADTVLDGARYGTYTLRAASIRGDSARYRGEPRRDALLTARFGRAEDALVLVAVAGGARAAENAHLAAADACRWIGEAVGRSHARLADDIRAGRRGDLKSGLHRLTDRSYGKLRARASELGLEPEEYTASLRCLLLPADPACRTRVFFGIGGGGLFRLRGGAWQDIEPPVPEPAAVTGAPVVGFGSVPSETPEGDRLTMDLGITTAPSPYVESVPPPTEPFRFRASVARPGDTLLLCSGGLADPLRGEPALAKELAERWAPADPPGLAEYLADTGLRVKGYADDRTAVAVWEA
ncbi:protein phosphatase 2C domain-containing protein [Streptomyces sp. NPDC002994]|uniref:protein phosphatase 2C domain-containing protein n=1 Tax=Streptomyces sp. NPDC002994 TaxID=3154441 RepID=UPI0033BD5C41